MSAHPLPQTARPCAECDGDGIVVWKTCGHSGSACPCRRHEAECEECGGTGAVLCSYCGDEPAVVFDGRWGYCDEHRSEAEHAA